MFVKLELVKMLLIMQLYDSSDIVYYVRSNDFAFEITPTNSQTSLTIS